MVERFANVAEMTDIHNRFLSLAQLMTVGMCMRLWMCISSWALAPSL